MPATRRRATLAAYLVAPLLAACGTGTGTGSREQPDAPAMALTHEQYQQAIWGLLASEDVRGATSGFSDVVAHDDDTERCTREVRAFHAHLQAVLRQVDQLRPPPDAADSQERFLAAAQESVDLVGVAADDVAAGRLACGPALDDRVYGLPSTQRAEAAVAELEMRGYVVGGD